MFFMSCEKTEQQVMPSANPQSKTENLDLWWTHTLNYTGKYFKSIPFVCPEYLTYTTKIDISNLQNKKSYTRLSDGYLDITIKEESGDNNGLIKYGPTNTGWWKAWGPPGYVESNNPTILHHLQGAITLVLSKKCYAFGFELGGQLKRNLPVIFGANFYDSDMSPGSQCELYLADRGCLLGALEISIPPENGAHLFAIKSDTAFDRITIHYYVEWDEGPCAYAITNIRYITNKEVYENFKRQ